MNATPKRETNPIGADCIAKTLIRGTLAYARAEAWYCHQLWIDTGVDVQRGDTTYELRQQRVLALLIESNLEDVPVLPNSARRETHGEFYQRLYGQKLDGSAVALQESLF